MVVFECRDSAVEMHLIHVPNEVTLGISNHITTLGASSFPSTRASLAVLAYCTRSCSLIACLPLVLVSPATKSHRRGTVSTFRGHTPFPLSRPSTRHEHNRTPKTRFKPTEHFGEYTTNTSSSTPLSKAAHNGLRSHSRPRVPRRLHAQSHRNGRAGPLLGRNARRLRLRPRRRGHRPRHQRHQRLAQRAPLHPSLPTPHPTPSQSHD